MSKNKLMAIFAGISLFSVLPVTMGIFHGVTNGSVKEGIQVMLLCALFEGGASLFLIWAFISSERESEKRLAQWKEQGFSDWEIELMLLERQRDRLEDLSYCRHGDWRSTIETRERLRDVENELQYLREHRW